MNENKDIRRYIEDIKKYKGAKLYSNNEDNTLLLEYIKCVDEIFNNMEKYTFVSDIKDSIITKMRKCSYSDMYSNDTSNLQNHITLTHNTKFRKDISFTLQYVLMMNDEQITRMVPITGYKCAYCSYICTSAECTQKHCILTHKNRKARITEGIIVNQMKSLHIYKTKKMRK